MHYESGGRQLIDDWFYVHRRWVFNLVLSNPDAVTLYRMSRSSTPQHLAQPLTRPCKRNRPAKVWLGRWSAGHELAAGVLIQPVEQFVGDGEGFLVGCAGEGETADQDVQAGRGGGVVAFVA